MVCAEAEARDILHRILPAAGPSTAGSVPASLVLHRVVGAQLRSTRAVDILELLFGRIGDVRFQQRDQGRSSLITTGLLGKWFGQAIPAFPGHAVRLAMPGVLVALRVRMLRQSSDRRSANPARATPPLREADHATSQ